jgi:hypothetical protein
MWFFYAGNHFYNIKKAGDKIEPTKGKQKTNKTLWKANLQTQKNGCYD